MAEVDHKIRLVFFGTPEFAKIGLQSLIDNELFKVVCVITQPDKAAGRGGKIQESPVKALAKLHNIPVLQPVKIKNEVDQFITKIREIGQIDLGVVIAFGQILPEKILTLPKLGCINVHASLLPRWRGAAPIQRAIMAGDRESGVCLMKMDEGLDTGAVYSSISIPIEPDTTAGELHDLLAHAGAKLLTRDIPEIYHGKLSALPQSESGITYASKILPVDMLIRWDQDKDSITRQIRALSPYPGAFSFLEGKRIKIFKAAQVTPLKSAIQFTPGKIAFVDSSRLEVECKDGNLSLEEVQLEGKRRLPIKEFLKGMRLDKTISFTDS